jgi:hypothetical protein
MAKLAIESVRMARALEAYSEAFSGKPEMN